MSAARRDIYDDVLPFEELDPCCQRELINEKKKTEINSKLRQVDRSNQRWDLRQTVFQLYGMNSCHCCQQTIDYDRLRALTAEMKQKETERKEDSDRPSFTEEDEEEEDEFADLEVDDIPLTNEEQLRLQQIQQYQQDLETGKKKYGMGVHWEESFEHILEFLANPTVPLVLHLYQSSSFTCARIDYIIEKYFCEKYLGTRFRRIPYSHRLANHEAFAEWKRFLSPQGTIFCFKGKNLIAHQKDLEEFGDGVDIVTQNVRKFLDHAHVLEVALPHESLLFPQEQVSQSKRKEEEEEESQYCEDPDCIKRYPHEHIGKSSGAPSFLSSGSRQGEEALAMDLLRRV